MSMEQLYYETSRPGDNRDLEIVVGGLVPRRERCSPDVFRLSVDYLRVEQAIFCAGMQRPAPDG
jgi:hypothetical protein